jgi:long-chain fatty acid transport protein
METRSTRLVPAVLATCFGLFLAAPDRVHGDGFRVLDQGANATAQGAAFSAQADDPSALHYNPAGMTQLPRMQLYLGTNLVSSNITFTSTTGETVSGGTSGAVANPPPSSVYVTASTKGTSLKALGDLAVGIGITSPFGLQVTYPNSGPLSTVTTYAALPLLDIKPTAAYRINEYLSVGAGLDIYTFSSWIGDGHAEQKRLAFPQGPTLEVNGTDSAVGFNLSALATLWRTDEQDPNEKDPNLHKPRLNLGIVYRSGPTLNLTGSFLVDNQRMAGAQAQFHLPWVLTGAAAVWPVRDKEHEWKLEVDVDYVNWTSYKNVDIKLSNGFVVPQPQNWSPTWVFMFGTEYKWLTVPCWEIAARGGYIHSATPVPAKTFAPPVPDSNYNAFSVGLGLLYRPPGWADTSWLPEGLGVDLAFQALVYDSRQIGNNDQPLVNGQWKSSSYVGSVSFRVNF